MENLALSADGPCGYYSHDRILNADDPAVTRVARSTFEEAVRRKIRTLGDLSRVLSTQRSESDHTSGRQATSHWPCEDRSIGAHVRTYR